MPRLRFPLQPWRAYSTARPELPSPLQRELFRRTAQPVAVLTAHIPSSSSSPSPSSATAQTDAANEQHNHGATLSSLASISLAPPLVSFSLRLPSRLASHLSPSPSPSSRTPSFRLHLLSSSQEPLARAFARQVPLPAPAAPSPPPKAGGPNPWDEPFASELFEALEKDGLGWMECSVVRRIPLHELEEEGREKAGGGEAAGWTPRSELFIARVEKVQLGKASAGGEGEGGKGSLVYWEQAYHSVPAGDGEKRNP
ncbi:hypothetical protein JCM8097_007261 [Rhodosporidiobolus ruineniae]